MEATRRSGLALVLVVLLALAGAFFVSRRSDRSEPLQAQPPRSNVPGATENRLSDDPPERRAVVETPQAGPRGGGEGDSASSQGPSLTVVVTDTEGLPVARADVSLRLYDDQASVRKGQTDADGRAVLPVDRLGPWSVEAMHENLYGRRFYALAGQEVSVQLTRCRRIQVRVIDELGIAVANADVRIIVGKMYVAGASTNSEGLTTELRIPEERELVAMAQGARISQSRVKFSSYDALPILTVTVEYMPYELTGLVSHNGQGVPNALVWDAENRQHSDTTKEDGSFSLGRYGNGSSILVIASHEDFLYAGQWVSIENTSAHVHIEAREGHDLEILVEDTEALPVGDVELSATVRPGWSSSPSRPPTHFEVIKRGRTDSNGQCALKGLPVGEVEILARHETYNIQAMRVNTPGQVLVRLTKKHDWTWTATLFPDVEQLVGREGWTITLTPEPDTVLGGAITVPNVRWFATTDRSGRAILCQIPEGRYYAHVESPNAAWKEDLHVDVAGEGWSYSGPNLVARLAAQLEGERLPTMSNDEYQATFFPAGSGCACLCRSGEVVFSFREHTMSLTLPNGTGTRWLDNELRGLRH